LFLIEEKLAIYLNTDESIISQLIKLKTVMRDAYGLGRGRRLGRGRYRRLVKVCIML